MIARQWFRASKSLVPALLASAVASLLLLAMPSEAEAQNTAPTTLVGSTSTGSVTVTITTAGTLSAINVLTLGAPNMDYKFVSGGSCASGTYTLPASCTVLYSFTPSSPWFRYGGISLADSAGHVLGSSFISGTGTGPQVSYPISATTTVSPLSTTLSSPSGIAVDGSGNIYLADATNVIELNAAGSTINTWSTGFHTPKGVAIDGSGNLYVADSGSTAIEKLIAVGGTVPSNATPVPIDGGSFSSPTAVAVDGSGNVFVADMNDIKEIVASSGTVVTLNAASSFSLPSGVAVDGSGNVYVADTGNGAIKKLPATSGTVTPGSAATTLASNFTSPTGIAVDGTGNLYVADASATPIQQINAAGGGPVTLGSGFSSPKGLAVDAGGNVFVADTGSNAAREMSAQTPPTVAFAATTPVGTTSTDSPRSVTVANNGNAALTFAGPPSISANFTLGPSPASTCPQLTTLAQGASCTDSISFVPTQAIPPPGSLTMTDNTLNAPGSMQPIPLTGTGSRGALTVTVTSPSVPVNTPSVTLSAMVAYGGVAPTGAVTFQVNNGTAFAATCSGSSSPRTCSATYDPSNLPFMAQGYPIAVNVVADTNYNAPATVDGTLTITPATTTLVISPTTASTVNAPITVTATLSSATGFNPISTAGTDTVTFTVDGATLCAAAPLSPMNHTAQCSMATSSSLTAGSHMIAATYNPVTDPNFQTSVAASVNQIVTAAPTTLAITSSGTSPVDSSVTLTATLSATNGFSPVKTATTDMVSFTATTANATGLVLCPPAPLSQATQKATCSTTALTAPSDVITATFLTADSNFTTPSAPTYTQVMTRGTPVITASSSLPTTAVVNQTVTLSAVVAAGAPATGVPPTGSVTFKQGSPTATGQTLCTAVITGSNATATPSCTYAFSASTSASGITIYAVYSGDTNFLVPATPVILTQVVSPAPTTTTITLPNSNITVGVSQSVTLAATVAPTNPISPNYLGTTLPQSGTISFSDSLAPTMTLCSIQLTAGVLSPTSCAGTFTAVGVHTVTATYTPSASDTNFQGSSVMSTYTVTVDTSNTTVAVSGLSTTATVDQTGDVFQSSFTHFPTNTPGTLSYFDGATPISGANCAGIPVSASGTLQTNSCSYTFTSAGMHSITASFTPTGGTAPLLTSSPLVINVGLTATLVMVTQPTGVQINAASTYQVTIVPAGSISDAGLTTPTKNVILTDTTNPTVTCTISLVAVSNGAGSCSLTPISAGMNRTITVSYQGDTNFLPSNTSFTETVAKATPSITITSSSPTSVATQPVTFTASASAAQAANQPTIASQVNFAVAAGSTMIPCAQVTLNSCSATIPASVSGTVSVNASYSGDSNYGSASTPSNGSTFLQTVQNFMLSTSTKVVTVSQGYTNLTDPYTTQPIILTVTPSNGFADKANFLCPTPTGSGLGCTATGITGAFMGVIINSGSPISPGTYNIQLTASSSTLPGSYPVQFTVSDSQVINLSQTTPGSAPSVTLTVANQAATVFVASSGQTLANFVAPTGETGLSCNPNLATGVTLSSLGIVCSAFNASLPVATTPPGYAPYTFTITTGSGGVARLDSGNSGIALAGLGAPFLLVLGLIPASRKLRKASLRSLAILVLGILLIHATGCSSGGFTAPQGTRATDGTYLIDVVNAQGATVAEIPLTIAN